MKSTTQLRVASSNQSDHTGSILLFILLALLVVYAILRLLPVKSATPVSNEKQQVSRVDHMAVKNVTPKAAAKKQEAVRSSRHVVVPQYTRFDSGIMPLKVESQMAAKTENLGMDDVKRSIATVMIKATGKTQLGPAKGESPVVQVKSEKDGRNYFVAADLPDKKKAANVLAELHRRSQYLLQSVDEQLDNNRRVIAGDGVDITDNLKELLRRHYKKDVPLAEYHNPSDQTVASNSDKGTVLQCCIRSKYDPSEWSSINTLFRVQTHELAHSADFHFRGDGEEAHGPVFKRLHKYLMAVAENLQIYNCAEYKKSGGRLCGLVLDESYSCGEPPKKQ